LKRFLALLGTLGLILSLFPDTSAAISAPFPDMEHSWFVYKKAVTYLKIKDIISGYPDGTFKPKALINRAEFLKIVFKGENPIGVSEPCFTDVDPAHSSIPWENLTRERAADLLWRLMRFKEERAIPRLSEGCGKAEPAPPSSVMVNGIERHFLLTTPKGYVSHDPVPLIVAFHGRTNSNEQVRSYYRLDREITDAFIVYPAALSNGNGTFSWSDGTNKPSEFRDIAFFDAIVERLSKEYCIDMERIFVVGHSLGAWFSNSLACVRGDVIRASATGDGGGDCGVLWETKVIGSCFDTPRRVTLPAHRSKSGGGSSPSKSSGVSKGGGRGYSA